MNEELRRVTESAVWEALSERSVGDPTVLGVLLAAGVSRRFGAANKLLAEVEGTPLVRHAARTLLDSRVSSVAAVLGHERERVRGALDGLDLCVVGNESYEEGMAASVRVGVSVATGMDADAVVFLPGDMPFVHPSTVDLLRDAHRANVADAAAAGYRGKRGNPVLFDSVHFAALGAVSGDVGGRQVLLDGDHSALVETDDPGVVADIDTRADLGRNR